MAGQRVTHSTTAVGMVTVHLQGSWRAIEVVNWGTAPLMVLSAKSGGTPPVMTWKGDDEDVVPVGASVVFPVLGGDQYDQGAGGGTQPGIDVFVFAQAAGSDFTVSGYTG